MSGVQLCFSYRDWEGRVEKKNKKNKKEGRRSSEYQTTYIISNQNPFVKFDEQDRNTVIAQSINGGSRIAGYVSSSGP